MKDNRHDLFDQMPEISEASKQKIHENIFTHYIAYRKIKKGELDDSGMMELPESIVLTCSRCGMTTQILKTDGSYKWHKDRITHNEYLDCPNCQQNLQLKNDNRGRRTIRHINRVAIFETVDYNHVWMRCFCIEREDFTDIRQPDTYWYEDERALLTPDMFYHWRRKILGYYNNTASFVLNSKPREPYALTYGGAEGYRYININSIQNTFLKYSAIDEYYGYNPSAALIRYLEYYCLYPILEYVVKFGFYQLAKSLVDYNLHGYGLLNWKAKKPKEFFKKLDLEETKLLLEKDVSTKELYRFVSFSKSHQIPLKKLLSAVQSVNWLNEICKLEKDNITVDPISTFRYLTKQKVFIHDYIDYLKECKKLRYSLQDEQVLFPSHFQDAHQRTSSLINHKKDKKTNTKIARRADELSSLEYESRLFKIVIPTSVNDIIHEGKMLRHCVGGYAERHAKGASTILFLRYRRRVDKPFYTIELSKTGEIKQCRGYQNCEQSKLVKAFMQEFEAHAKEVLTEKKHKVTA